MGDISELRGLVVAGTFITVAVLLISFIPHEFYVSGEDVRTIETLRYFEAIDLQNFADTYNFTMTNASLGLTGIQYFGGYNFQQLWIHQPPIRNTETVRYDVWFIFKWEAEDGIIWHDNERIGPTMTAARLNADFSLGGTDNLEYTLKFEVNQLSFHMFYSFNTTTYDTPLEAWDQSELYALWGIDFDQARTGYNAWDIIALLLFFNLPTVHVLLNALIAVPLWIAIVYLSYILILRAIGAIFGGGA